MMQYAVLPPNRHMTRRGEEGEMEVMKKTSNDKNTRKEKQRYDLQKGVRFVNKKHFTTSIYCCYGSKNQCSKRDPLTRYHILCLFSR